MDLSTRYEPRNPLLMLSDGQWVDYGEGLGEWCSTCLRWYLGGNDREWGLA